MSLTIHLDKVTNVTVKNGYQVFKSTNTDVAKWKKNVNGAKKLRFRQELFDKVCLSFCNVTLIITLIYFLL